MTGEPTGAPEPPELVANLGADALGEWAALWQSPPAAHWHAADRHAVARLVEVRAALTTFTAEHPEGELSARRASVAQAMRSEARRIERALGLEVDTRRRRAGRRGPTSARSRVSGSDDVAAWLASGDWPETMSTDDVADAIENDQQTRDAWCWGDRTAADVAVLVAELQALYDATPHVDDLPVDGEHVDLIAPASRNGTNQST